MVRKSILPRFLEDQSILPKCLEGQGVPFTLIFGRFGSPWYPNIQKFMQYILLCYLEVCYLESYGVHFTLVFRRSRLSILLCYLVDKQSILRWHLEGWVILFTRLFNIRWARRTKNGPMLFTSIICQNEFYRRDPNLNSVRLFRFHWQ